MYRKINSSPGPCGSFIVLPPSPHRHVATGSHPWDRFRVPRSAFSPTPANRILVLAWPDRQGRNGTVSLSCLPGSRRQSFSFRTGRGQRDDGNQSGKLGVDHYMKTPSKVYVKDRLAIKIIRAPAAQDLKDIRTRLDRRRINTVDSRWRTGHPAVTRCTKLTQFHQLYKTNLL
ncbi:hypothetical protein J6590_025060 [Homalodisca vitripennis]|nr:hypothetical protein J6590_025060 [Homalodisca vitripennis]